MSQERLKILLIEHDPGFARMVGEMLGQAREFSADMKSALDLNDGLSALKRDHFDVVVLDAFVPDGAGRTAHRASLDRLRALRVDAGRDRRGDQPDLDAARPGGHPRPLTTGATRTRCDRDRKSSPRS